MSTALTTTPSPNGLSETSATEHAPTDDLRGRAVRGALMAGTAQGTAFVVRTGSLLIMARLLFPADFGLVGMVTAITGFMAFFHDFGLSTASIQRVSITEDQMSTLFWVNLAAGVTLALACAGMAPLLVWFYGEPRLFAIASVSGLGFLFNSSAVQHRALLTRNMRFGALAIIDTVALFAGVAAGVGSAFAGLGYWSLVVMAIVPTAVGAVATWLATRWVPGGPRRLSEVRSMLMFGGTLTANSLLVYIAYNTDKILIGRFWGAGPLGLYGRAYQLINIPTENLNSTLSQVALPALARLQNDPQRLRSYFLRGYGMFVALLVPVTCAFALFADDIVLMFLGARWHDAAILLRLLAPTIIGFAIINPLGWLMLATGRAGRSLRIALVLAPVVMTGYSIGLLGGAHGVALGFSGAMIVLAPIVVVWATHGMPISARDVFDQVAPLAIPIGVAAAVVLVLEPYVRQLQPVLLRLTVETAALLSVYLFVLLVVMGRKSAYVALIRDLRPRSVKAQAV